MRATLEILADRPWFVVAFLQPLSISIDGRLARLPWGRHVFELEPGTHALEVGVGRTFNSKAVLEVTLAAGDERRLRYLPRLAKNLRGRLVEERIPTARVVRGS